MTREWFEDNINNLEDLIDFCASNGCDVMNDCHHEEAFDSFVCDDIRSATRTDYWTDIRSELNRVYDEHCGEYFFYSGRFEYVWLTNDWDFEEYKNRVIDWAEDSCFFEEIPDEDIDDEDPEEEPIPEDDSFETPDLTSLFGL